MNDRDKRGDVALWQSKSDNPKAPQAKGTVVAHRDIREGEEIDIALWRNQSDNPKAPAMTGRISDKRQKATQETHQPDWHDAQADYGDPDDLSNIPF